MALENGYHVWRKRVYQDSIFNLIYPVGSYYMSSVNTNPATLFGVGTWSRIPGRMLIGVDESDPTFSGPNLTGGEKAHTLSVSEVPSHSSSQEVGGMGLTNAPSFTDRVQVTATPAAHNNLPPYRTAYIWLRTT